ncbi:uncharacterized protein BDZ99DRAFT_102809 [Mytilinidion resinicola]|uniref:Uncharacterized protein n=1 Tax=Mytilinidion resinicola TaxID=574789 RepID=A0A6A6YB54_9PEZI|nr:uncharacterized protein BDZ99DRAFT_102809 [Mytilinidion resinicola]KAF2806042.1 hypothetical protein BDZ99DRAFT_102809 [Mytilinidion resinicola]
MIRNHGPLRPASSSLLNVSLVWTKLSSARSITMDTNTISLHLLLNPPHFLTRQLRMFVGSLSHALISMALTFSLANPIPTRRTSVRMLSCQEANSNSFTNQVGHCGALSRQDLSGLSTVTRKIIYLDFLG